MSSRTLTSEQHEARKQQMRDYYATNRAARKVKAAEFRANNREHISNQQRAVYRKQPWAPLYHLAKHRASEKQLEFTITKQDVEVQYHLSPVCPILGIEIRVGDGKPTENSPTVDRIDNNKGYVPGNIQVVSYLANRMKSNATQDQLIRFAKWVLTNNETTCNVCTTETS